jgi:hypothetical protein
MDMLCPECMGLMATTDGQNARCTVHGGQYRIMFTRAAQERHNFTPPPLTPMMCGIHPAVRATERCATCGTPICATCDFAFPGGLHLCPNCASKPTQGLNPRRKKTLIFSYLLAVWCTLGVAVLLSGKLAGFTHTPEDLQALGTMLMLFVFVPALVGVGLAFGSLDRRLGNPVSVMISVVWNSIIVAILVILTVIGNLKR